MRRTAHNDRPEFNWKSRVIETVDNRKRLLSALFYQGPLSRTQLASHLTLSKAAVTNLVRSLINEGVVEEFGARPGSPGRPHILLRIRPDALPVVAIQVKPHGMYAEIVGLDGKAWCAKNYSLPQGPQETFSTEIADAIRDLIRTWETNYLTSTEGRKPRVRGIGVAFTGLVESGKVTYSATLQLRNLPLASDLQLFLQVPVVLVNDANAAAIAEWVYGDKRKASDLLYIGLEPWGLGAGIVRHGELYPGVHGGAGELGHLNVQPGGLPCVCGNRGCLQLYASELSMLMRGRHLVAFEISPALRERCGASLDALDLEMMVEVSKSDPTVRNALEEAIDYLSLGVSDLITVFDPERVVVGGGTFNTLGVWGLEMFKACLERHSYPLSDSKAEVKASVLGSRGSVMGAAYLVHERLVQDGLHF